MASIGILLLNLSYGTADVIASAELVNQTPHYCALLKQGQMGYVSSQAPGSTDFITTPQARADYCMWS